MNFLFWNLNGKDLLRPLAEIARENFADILILAECSIPDVGVLEALNESGAPFFGIVPNLASNRRIRLFSQLPLDSFIHLKDAGTSVFYSLKSPIGERVNLVAVHFSSKLYQSDHEQTLNAARLGQSIRETEASEGHSRTIVVGDLNMNPFEHGMVAADSFHAVMTKQIARRMNRVVGGVERMFFYNPMWGRFGDLSPGPPGTYYYAGGNQIAYFWHMFDQVLVRPDLLDQFEDQSLRIIDKFGTTSLGTPAGVPDGTEFSDHFPVFFSISI